MACGFAASGCGPDPLEVLSPSGEVYTEEANKEVLTMAVGDRFTILLPGGPAGRAPFKALPKRPRADGKVVHFEAMGLIPKDHESQAGGPGFAYTFEVISEGRGRVVVFDAAMRERFTLRVTVGDKAQAKQRAKASKTKTKAQAKAAAEAKAKARDKSEDTHAPPTGLRPVPELADPQGAPK